MITRVIRNNTAHESTRARCVLWRHRRLSVQFVLLWASMPPFSATTLRYTWSCIRIGSLLIACTEEAVIAVCRYGYIILGSIEHSSNRHSKDITNYIGRFIIEYHNNTEDCHNINSIPKVDCLMATFGTETATTSKFVACRTLDTICINACYNYIVISKNFRTRDHNTW
jgi:hypothetical protein